MKVLASPVHELETERLVLRPLDDNHRDAMAAITADIRVMEWLGGVLTREESDGYVDRKMRHFTDHGFGHFAMERKDDAAIIGFIGLQHVPYQAHFTPAVEIGWRVAHSKALAPPVTVAPSPRPE